MIEMNGYDLVDVPKKMFNELSTSRIIKSYPQFILIEHEQKALLGSIEISSINWNGSLRYYDNTSDFNKKNAAVIEETYDGCGDATFLTQDKFVVVGDKGAVEIFQIVQATGKPQTLELQSLNSACYHDDSVYTVSAFSDSKSIVTGGLDCCIKIWDVESLIATHSYSFAHVNCITGTDVKPMCNSVFASTSLHGDALMWDIRKSEPAHCILDRKQKCSSISWNPVMDQYLAIGEDCGVIALIDIRQPNEPVFELTVDNRSVWKVLFNPIRKDLLACCFDNTSVKVLHVSKDVQVIMEDNEHTDFVRGLAWYKDDLFSCALDDNVIKRTVSFNDNK
ncbi:methylosome protein 50-like [Odontomachus brunneus]|uniref:methylosome protein 50-like n=1 Tax=Odontomachus brunneus TaxID=486640 RepID=UPI0013F26C6E|nr:methylosome protein 50-like [Odontomachus brunneus]